MGETVIFIVLLALTVAIVGAMGVHLVYRAMERKKRVLQARLGGAPPPDEQGSPESVYAQMWLKETKTAEELSPWAQRSVLLRKFNQKLVRAYPGVVLGRFLLITGCTGLGAFLFGFIGLGSMVVGIVAAAIAMITPFVVVSSRCAKRLRVIDEQLPEALDFLSRILRAGHSLSTGFQMASEELPEPLASEFGKCYDQHSLGTPIEEAMRVMAERVGTSDFAFFVTAVLIQRQTGGDLAEVLTNIGSMVRARLRLQQHVKAITAEGRLVGYVLLVLPVFFFMVLYMLNRKYAEILLNTREGSIVLTIAVGLQLMGMLAIRKIVQVKM